MRLLPQELPRDEFHAEILEALRDGRANLEQLMPMFYTPAGFMTSMFYLTMHLHEYELAGRQTFIVPSSMQNALAATSLAEIAPEEFQLPYNSLYVALPECSQVIWGGTRTGWHRVGGVFLHRIEGRHRMGKLDVANSGISHHLSFNKEQEVDAINVYLWGTENSKSYGKGDDANFWLTIDFNQMRKEGHADLESYLHALFGNKDNDASLEGLTELGKALDLVVTMPEGDAKKVVFRNVIDVLRIIFNAILYLDSEGAETEEDKESIANRERRQEVAVALGRIKNVKKGRGRRLTRELASLPRDQVIWVGKNLSNTLEAQSSTPRARSRETWVRGHWWPRRDTIRRRIMEARESVASAQEQVDELQHNAVNLHSSEAEAIAQAIQKVAKAEVRAKAARTQADTRAQKLEAKRRWVKPYKRNKGVGCPVESHTYMVSNEDEDTDIA